MDKRRLNHFIQVVQKDRERVKTWMVFMYFRSVQHLFVLKCVAHLLKCRFIIVHSNWYLHNVAPPAIATVHCQNTIWIHLNWVRMCMFAIANSHLNQVQIWTQASNKPVYMSANIFNFTQIFSFALCMSGPKSQWLDMPIFVYVCKSCDNFVLFSVKTLEMHQIWVAFTLKRHKLLYVCKLWKRAEN